MVEQGLQEKYAPKSCCFGCGPANSKGLQIRSLVQGEEVIARWLPQPHHEAFPGVLNGGIIGSLLDCHSNWAAAWHLMQESRFEQPPCTVTAEYSVKLLRPTPTDGPLDIVARVVESLHHRVRVEATLSSHSKICAQCSGIFVAVRAGHPAYHRW